MGPIGGRAAEFARNQRRKTLCRWDIPPHHCRECLIDTNGDNVPDSREFAGSHRYETAVKLAERFAADEGSISTVIIASGETQVDAVTASGLAGNLNAPVLLTRSNQLPHNVARFIDEQNVTDVVVVGGTAAVPDAIVTAIESLGSRPDVERIAGDDRYATAAAIGDRLGGPNPTWCGSTQSAAILVNGGVDGRADAIISGPLAFRLGLPILLTTADEMPEATAAFLTDNKVERVVIVGGTGAISAGVVTTLIEEIGVVNAPRIAGSSAAETSVMVAKEMLGSCAAVLGTNPNMVALVNRDATADGITAAPVLGRGLGDDGPVPVLLVGDELPAHVGDYLSNTAEVRGGNKTHLSILAIGGRAVVSDSVMADAVAEARTSAMLTAEIKVKVDPVTKKYETHRTGTGDDAVTGGVFSVTFSDDVKLPVDADDPADGIQDDEIRGTALDPTLYRLNGRRLEAVRRGVADDVEIPSVVDLVFTADRTVRITLSHILEPNDVISLEPRHMANKGQIGANMDRRKLKPESLMLGALPVVADRAGPAVEILAVDGLDTFEVFVSEPNLLHNELDPDNAGDDWLNYVRVRKAPRSPDITITSRTMSNSTPGSLTGRHVAGDLRPGLSAHVTVTASRALQPGDEVIVERRTFLDTGGRGNSERRVTVQAVKDDDDSTAAGEFEITSVSIGDVVHTSQASVVFGSSAGTSAMLEVTALRTGAAAGAAGNDWIVYGYDDRPDSDDTAAGVQNANAFDIDVAVDIANKRISYTISQSTPERLLPQGVDGPTLGDLASALASNSDFVANFTVGYADPTTAAPPQGTGSGKDTPLDATTPAGERFGDGTGASADPTAAAAADIESIGTTSVGVVVKFNDAIRTLQGTSPGDDLAQAIAVMFPVAAADRSASDAMTVNFLAPDNVVHISYTADTTTELPTRLGFRVIPNNVAVNYNGAADADGVSNVREILNSLRPDSSIKHRLP